MTFEILWPTPMCGKLECMKPSINLFLRWNKDKNQYFIIELGESSLFWFI
jgi:hypothetical protein